jgi:hypothetical protein
MLFEIFRYTHFLFLESSGFEHIQMFVEIKIARPVFGISREDRLIVDAKVTCRALHLSPRLYQSVTFSKEDFFMD